MKSKNTICLFTGTLMVALLTMIAVSAQNRKTPAPRKPEPAPATEPAKSPAPAEPQTTNDLKLKTRMSLPGEKQEQGMSFDSLVYIKGERERTEMNMPGMPVQIVTVRQCDLRRNLSINDSAKVYRIDPFAEPDKEPAAPVSVPQTTSKPTRKGGILTINVSITDTGERREMFGYQARRLKMAMSMDSSPDACSKVKMRMESDGWYINFRQNFSCEELVPRQAVEQRLRPDCVDRWKYNYQGGARIGYPADVTTTMYAEDGKATSFRQQILELSRAKLEQSLFEIPEGYKEGDPYSMSAMMGGAMNREAIEALMKDAEKSSRNSGSATAMTGTKKPGAIRLGVVRPSARIGQTDVSTAIRNTLVSNLNGQSVEIVALDSAGEAASMQCDFVLNSTLTHQAKKEGGFGSLMKKAASVGSIAAGGVGGAMSGTGESSSPQSAAAASAALKSKEEITFEYQLSKPDGASVATNSLKTKVKSDGEDAISPLLSQTAGEVIKAVTKR